MKKYKQSIILGFLALFAVGYAVYPTESTQEMIFRKVSEQTLLLTDADGVKGGGTGFAVRTPSGHVYTLTNAHICHLASAGGSLRATSKEGGTMYLHVLGIAKDRDLCVVSAFPGKQGLELATSLREGQTIYVVGHPHLLPNTPSSGLYTYRDFIQLLDPSSSTEDECESAEGSWKQFQTFFGPLSVCVQSREAGFTDARTYPGNSGSAVTNSNGDVVGVIFAGDGVLGYFVPRDLVEDFLSKY